MNELKYTTVTLYQTVFCGYDSFNTPVFHPQGVDVDVCVYQTGHGVKDLVNGAELGVICVPRDNPYIWEGQLFVNGGALWRVCFLPPDEYLTDIPGNYRQYSFIYVSSVGEFLAEADAIRTEGAGKYDGTGI